VKLDIGAGLIASDYVGLDLHVWPGHEAAVDVIADLERPLPFADGCFNEVRAHDVLEHVYRLLPLMDELWRVLEAGGLLDIEVPKFPHADSVGDPTHVRYFVPVTFMYFTLSYGQRFKMACKPWDIEHLLGTPNRVECKLRKVDNNF
jgi:SAM-dependent methyltransferase